MRLKMWEALHTFKKKKVGDILTCLLKSMKQLLHLGISLTSRIVFQDHRKPPFYPVHLFMLHWILHLVQIPCREVFFHLPSMVGNLLLSLYSLLFSQSVCEVSSPASSMATMTTKWNGAPGTHKSATVQTSCEDSSPPICLQLHECKQICGQVLPLRSPTSLKEGLLGFFDGFSVDGKETEA